MQMQLIRNALFFLKAGWQSSVPDVQDHLRRENGHAASREDGVPHYPSLSPRIPRLQDHSHRLRHSCRDPGQSCATLPKIHCVMIRRLDSLNLGLLSSTGRCLSAGADSGGRLLVQEDEV